jgi:hypothetical protein
LSSLHEGSEESRVPSTTHWALSQEHSQQAQLYSASTTNSNDGFDWPKEDPDCEAEHCSRRDLHPLFACIPSCRWIFSHICGVAQQVGTEDGRELCIFCTKISRGCCNRIEATKAKSRYGVFMVCVCKVDSFTFVTGDDSTGVSVGDLLAVSARVATLWKFISDMEGTYTSRTVVNYSAALQWHLVYLRYLLHSETKAIRDGEEEVLSSFQPKTGTEIKVLVKEMKEGMKKLHEAIKKSGEIAEKETKERNGKEALQERGAWVEVADMMVVKAAIDEEGWARMSSLRQRIEHFGLAKLLSVCMNLSVVKYLPTFNDYFQMPSKRKRNPVLAQFDWLRDWVIFSFFVDLPPMRPQNAELQIMDVVEPKGSRTRNGILFFKDAVHIQIVLFKTKRFIGDRVMPVPASLEKKLRAYVEVVRPVYGTQYVFIF